MAVIAIRQFMGEIPKIPAHLLPDGAAASATNCDFSSGVLTPLKGGADMGKSAPNGPVTSLFFRDTDTSKWYSSKAHSSRVYRSPVTDDSFKRVYMIQKQSYTGTGGISMVTNAHLIAFQWGNATNGGEPTDSAPYTGQCGVGVPTPSAAPTLTLIDLTGPSGTGGIPSMTSPKVEIKGWWEADGVRHEETVLLASAAPAEGTKYMREWVITANAPTKTTTPAVDENGDPTGEETETGTPLEAVFGASLTLKDGDTLIFTLSSTTNAAVPARSSALPGGVEMSIKKNNTTPVSATDAASRAYTLTLSWGVVETRAYVFTVVNRWNEESAPSPAALVSLNYLQKVKVKCALPVMRQYGNSQVSPPVRPYYYQKRKLGADGCNVYRTFGGSANYLKIKHGTGSTYERTSGDWAQATDDGEYPTAQGPNVYDFIIDDVHTPNSVGSGLISLEWSLPIDGDDTDSSGALYATTVGQPEGLTQMPNGWFSMYRGNTLYMSEPYRPHTWPYSMTFPSDIKATCMGAQMLVVATQDAVFIVNGSHPAAVSQTRLPVPVGGVSQLGICNVNGAVAMVTNDGILLINGSQASLEMSQSLFTRETWRSRYANMTVSLNEMRLSYHDGFLIGSLPGADGFAVRIDEATGSFTKLTTRMYSAANFPLDDSLLYTTNDDTDGRKVYKFRAGTDPLTLTWKSKEYTFQRHESMGAFYLRASGAATVTIYVEGVAYYTTTTFASNQFYRIPANRKVSDGLLPAYTDNAKVDGRGLRWQVEITTTSTVYEFVMAQTMQELKSV